MDDVDLPLIDLTQRDSATANGRGSVSSVVVEFNKYRTLASIEPDPDSVRSILQQHARDGNFDGVSALLQKYPNSVDRTDVEQYTALHFASRYGHERVVQLLLEKGADPNATNFEQLTPLHMVAKYCKDDSFRTPAPKDIGVVFFEDAKIRSKSAPSPSVVQLNDTSLSGDIVALLVGHLANVNLPDKYGLRPLHYAAMKDNKSAATALIAHGADVDAEDQNKNTPLLTSCIYGAEEVMRVLLDAGADYKQGKENGRSTAFHIAAQHGNENTLIYLLVKAGTSGEQYLTMPNSEGKTPLCLAVEGNHPRTSTQILKFRKKVDGKYEWQGREKWLLHLAAHRGYLDVVKVLLEFDMDLELSNNMDRLPIHMAAEKNQAQVVQYLVEKAPLTRENRDETGLTPLLLAAGNNDGVDALRVLLENGANMRSIDNDGRSVVYIAAKYNSIRCLKFVLTKLKEEEAEKTPSVRVSSLRINPIQNASMVNRQDHSQNSPMHIVCSNGYLETCRLLYEHGASIDILNEDEETPLHLAAFRGRTETVRQLLEWDKRLVLSREEMGDTPLHLAARNGHDVVTKVLLESGADIESRNARDNTPLLAAVGNNQIATVRQLVQLGAKVENAEDKSSHTPLHIAARNGNEEIVRYLLSSSSISIDRRTTAGETALEIALRRGKKEVARALLEDDRWRLLMTPNDTVELGRHSNVRKTPLRELLAKFPDLATIVFDKCISGNGEENNYNYVVEYDFELLDDTYMMLNSEGNALAAGESPYDEGDNFKLKDEARSYTEDFDVVYKNHPLKLMANSEKLSLLSHPLVSGLIKYKWNSLGRYVYYSALFVYVVFILLYTIFITQTPAPYNVFDENTGTMMDLTVELSNANGTCSAVRVKISPAISTVTHIIIILAALQIIKEGYQLVSRRLAYITLENACELFIYSSAIVTVVDISSCSSATGLRLNWQWLLAAVCAFMCWMNLLMLIRKLPRFGIYVVMFFDIFRTFSRFFIIFVLFIVAFSIAFFVIMQNRPEFSTVGSAVLKTTVMMIGEFEFTSIFHGDEAHHPERLFGHAIAYPLFLLFCVVMTILLMNLLVGLAVDDIKSVQEKAELKRLVMTVDLVLQVETSMAFIRKKTARGRLQLFKNHQSRMKWLRSKFGFDSSGDYLEATAHLEEDEATSELRNEVKQQSSQIKNLQANIDIMYGKQLQLEGMLRSLLNYNDIEYKETDE